MALDPVLQELVDKAAIRDLMARYARGVDGRDPELIASTLTSDAYANYGEWDGKGRDNIVNWIMRPSDSHFRSTHFMGDQVVQLDGDSAEVETYAVAFGVHDVEGASTVVITGLRYVDEMVRQDGQWLVRHRMLHHDWRGNVPADASPSSQDWGPVSE